MIQPAFFCLFLLWGCVRRNIIQPLSGFFGLRSASATHAPTRALALAVAHAHARALARVSSPSYPAAP